MELDFLNDDTGQVNLLTPRIYGYSFKFMVHKYILVYHNAYMYGVLSISC